METESEMIDLSTRRISLSLGICVAFPKSFVYDDNDVRSSLTIMDRSLQINQTYEFYVELYEDKQLIEKSDVVLVEIQSKDSNPIEIS